jgi:hypothetical protein
MSHEIPAGTRSGTNAFRLMPEDDGFEAPSSLDIRHTAGGRAVLLSYTWHHPEDGEQTGTLMLGTTGDDGVRTAGWVDSWHQPAVTLLAGTDTVLGYEYAPGWRWEVEVAPADGAVTMVMRNVVPDRDDEPGLRYAAMRASWT